jgi:hypothetical protein
MHGSRTAIRRLIRIPGHAAHRKIETLTCFLGAAALFAFMSTLILAQDVDPAPHWPQWRGPHRDGTVTSALPTNWPATLTKRWELTVGGGHSSPVVAGNRVVIHTRQGTVRSRAPSR